MFVSLCGPPLAIWKPVVYVKSWLVKGRREANSTQGPARSETVLNDHSLESLWNVLFLLKII
jgi:hypothetical protein